jgi:hypothetical protein
MEEPKVIIELKEVIAQELGNCNEHLWPKLCELRHSEKGYGQIEDMVIRYVALEAMPVGSAIAFVEQELQHAGIDVKNEK